MLARSPRQRPAITASVMLSTPPLTATATSPISFSTACRGSSGLVIGLSSQRIRFDLTAAAGARRMAARRPAQAVDLGLGGRLAVRPGDALDGDLAGRRLQRDELAGEHRARLEPPAQADRRGL